MQEVFPWLDHFFLTGFSFTDFFLEIFSSFGLFLSWGMSSAGHGWGEVIDGLILGCGCLVGCLFVEHFYVIKF